MSCFPLICDELFMYIQHVLSGRDFVPILSLPELKRPFQHSSTAFSKTIKKAESEEDFS